MNAFRFSRPLALGIGSLALLGFSLPAFAGGSSDLVAASHGYSYIISFTTPSPFLTTGTGDVLFQFNPETVGAAPATAKASNLSYSTDWQVGIPSTFGDASIDYFAGTATINNTDAKNGFDVPITNFGQDFSFNLAYTDPPGPIASDFSVVLRSGALGDQSLFDLQFDPSTGQTTLLNSIPGVTITPQGDTPPVGSPNPVPEASTTVSLGLLLALGGAVVVAKRKKVASGL